MGGVPTIPVEGYVDNLRPEAERFFPLISQRYVHGSVILISNKYFSDWDELLSNNVLVTALLDRLLHHAHILNIQTYRLKDRLKTSIHTVPPAQLPANGEPTSDTPAYVIPAFGGADIFLDQF